MNEYPHLQKLKNNLTFEELNDLILQDDGIYFGVLYGDFYSCQDSIPYGVTDNH